MRNNDLISRAAAIDEIEDYLEEYSELEPETGYHNLKWCAMEEAKDALLALPAVDAAPVVHGRWMKYEDRWIDTHYQCSECGYEWFLEDGNPIDNGMNFCPNCGAKMDE